MHCPQMRATISAIDCPQMRAISGRNTGRMSRCLVVFCCLHVGTVSVACGLPMRALGPYTWTAYTGNWWPKDCLLVWVIGSCPLPKRAGSPCGVHLAHAVNRGLHIARKCEQDLHCTAGLTVFFLPLPEVHVIDVVRPPVHVSGASRLGRTAERVLCDDHMECPHVQAEDKHQIPARAGSMTTTNCPHLRVIY